MPQDVRRRLIGFLALCLAWPVSWAKATETLPVLAEVGPWPVVSRLIGFGDRLWFASSTKGRNHNSADLYSYDRETGETRYERHLFSQDAGRPVVADGLLHWPFEDARFSLGFGHFMTTDGDRWRPGVIPTGQIFHTHAIAATSKGGLIAATSAWRAHLDFSPDGGASWRQVYDHPTPERRVSRIVDLVTLGPITFGSLTSADQRGLMRLDGASVGPVPGWPAGHHVIALTVYLDHVYGLVQMPNGMTVWRTDGYASEQLSGPGGLGLDSTNGGIRDLIADQRGLWTVTTNDTGGWIWQSPDGNAWTRRYGFEGGQAVELSSYQGQLFVGGTDKTRGVGMLWGTPVNVTAETPTAAGFTRTRERRGGDLPARLPPGSVETDWETAAVRLDRMLADPKTYEGRGQLRDLIFDLARAEPPAGLFAERLNAPMPDREMSLIGGAVRVPAALIGRAALLWGMSLLGEQGISNKDRIPLDWLSASWTRPANRSEKYFDSQPFALWAAASTGQDDRSTLDVLIARLEQRADPLWLRGDVVGALAALTGQRFGYDVGAWQRWWSEARPSWVSRTVNGPK